MATSAKKLRGVAQACREAGTRCYPRPSAAFAAPSVITQTPLCGQEISDGAKGVFTFFQPPDAGLVDTSMPVLVAMAQKLVLAQEIKPGVTPLTGLNELAPAAGLVDT
jgi:hypothetical protein